MRIVTVFNTRTLRRGLYAHDQEFKVEHVQSLQRQLAKWAPLATFECLSDVKVPGVTTVPLRYGWPGWWAKLEMFRPDFPGGFLFMDLDTVITGDLSDILAVEKLTLLRDWYRDGVKLKRGLGGGLIYFPADDCRREVWEFFTQQPQLQMRVFSRGDQFLFEKFWLNTAAEWQNLLPGQVASWKVTCKNGVVPPNTRLITFHGVPRPWQVGQFLHLYQDSPCR